MKQELLLIRETAMSDGIDKIYAWSSVKEAHESGRFEYLNEMWDEDMNDGLTWKKVCKIKSLRKFIETVDYPFSIIEK